MQVKEPTFSVSNMFTFNSQQYFKYFDLFISRSRLFRSHLDVTVAGKRLQNVDLWSVLTVFEQRGTPALIQDPGYCGHIRWTTPGNLQARDTLFKQRTL